MFLLILQKVLMNEDAAIIIMLDTVLITLDVGVLTLSKNSSGS